MRLVSRFRNTVAKHIQFFPARPQKCEPLDKSAVAKLSESALNDMTCDELVHVIRAAELPMLCLTELQRRLPFYDRETLKRLAFLARRSCQVSSKA
jgi:hypothetical protein